MPAPRPLPWSWYSDPEVLRREQERIFRRTWQYVGQEREEGFEAEGLSLVRSGILEEGRLLGESEQLVARLQELVGTALS